MADMCDSLRPYACVRLHTNVHDQYAGVVASNRFLGKRLLLKVIPLARVEETENPSIWRVISIHPEYEFEFDIRKREQDEAKKQARFISADGDIIVLTNNPLEIQIIKSLFEDIASSA